MENLLSLINEEFGSEFVSSKITNVEVVQLKNLTLADLDTGELVGLAVLSAEKNPPNTNSKLMSEATSRLIKDAEASNPFIDAGDMENYIDTGFDHYGNKPDFFSILQNAYMRRLGRVE